MLSRSWISAFALLPFAGTCFALEPSPAMPGTTTVIAGSAVPPGTVLGMSPAMTGTSGDHGLFVGDGMGSSCGSGCPQDDCSHSRFWAKTEFLLGWIRSERLPPLVTTSPAGTPAVSAGLLGGPSALVIGGTVNGDTRSGLRVETGYVIDPCRGFGIEGGGMVLESDAALPSVSSTGTPIIARPFTDVTTNLQNSVLVAFPGTSSGSVSVRARSGNLYEAHLDLTESVFQRGGFKFDTLLGWRFYRLDDSLRISQTLFPTSGTFVPGTRIDSVDAFGTHNTFNGIDLGLKARFQGDALSLDVLTKVAVGRLERFVNVQGSTLINVPGTPVTASSGGLLALSPNIGGHGSREYTLFPELGVNLGYKISPHFKVTMGYSLFLLDSIARAGEQVNLNVNPNLFPTATGTGGANQPLFNLGRADVWTQTVSFGAEFSF